LHFEGSRRRSPRPLKKKLTNCGDEPAVDAVGSPAGSCDEDRPGPPQKLKAKEIFVDVLWNGVWYKAEVLAKRGDKSLIHYDGFSTRSDEWVTADRIKPRGAAAPAPKAPPPAVAASGGVQGLFYRTVVLPKALAPQGGPLATYPFLFLPDGHVLRGDWSALSDYFAVGLEEYKRSGTQPWGTYKTEAGAIVVTWTGGREERFEIEQVDGGLKIKGLLRAYPVKRGVRLDGKYLQRTTGKVSSVSSYTFRSDMSVRSVFDSAMTEDVVGLGGDVVDRDVNRQQVVKQGTYSFDGYVLQMVFEKNVLTQTAWVLDAEDARSDAPRMISFGAVLYHRQD